MLALAHAGLTLGCAIVISEIYRKYQCTSKKKETVQSPAEITLQARPVQLKCTDHKIISPHKNLGVDYRLVILGSLLPDIIDKPLGQWIFSEIFSNGRIFGHTLLFLLIFLIIGSILFHATQKKWVLTISFGVFLHLVLDAMWLMPDSLFWPLYGFVFNRIDLSAWGYNMLTNLFTIPSVFVSEIMGALILIYFVVLLWLKRYVWSFIKSGNIPSMGIARPSLY
jgi:inner membrane protein